ncbi:hypothetical protein AB4Y87_03610 [Paenarthrobacter sp. RAF54_2]|uniref:hypothetical protein n=1 Tax=Paenarthrobacter sp. RAF54_2 TaxID=3233061 RepID=UPI003F947170
MDLGSSSLLSSSATELGLAPSDLLQLTRVVVLVEGAHDEIVFDSVLGEDIRRARGRIIPINGAGHAKSIADARILLDATTATIVLVLDNVDSQPVLDVWNQATQACRDGNRKAAKSILSGLSRLGRGGEVVWLQALGERAIETNVLHRIKPFGLLKRDVLCYLPTSSFLSGTAGWEELSADYERARNAGTTKEDFKSWLKHMRGADFSRDKVKEAALSLGGDLPREFADLALKIYEFSIMGPIDELERLL